MRRQHGGTTCQNCLELARFDRFYVTLETSGLFRWAWRIQNVQLTGPHANVVVRPGGKLNRAVLIASCGHAVTAIQAGDSLAVMGESLVQYLPP